MNHGKETMITSLYLHINNTSNSNKLRFDNVLITQVQFNTCMLDLTRNEQANMICYKLLRSRPMQSLDDVNIFCQPGLK